MERIDEDLTSKLLGFWEEIQMINKARFSNEIFVEDLNWDKHKNVMITDLV